MESDTASNQYDIEVDPTQLNITKTPPKLAEMVSPVTSKAASPTTELRSPSSPAKKGHGKKAKNHVKMMSLSKKNRI